MAETHFGVEVQSGSSKSCSIVVAKGPLVLENLFKFQSAWRGVNDDKLIFDLSEVPYMDSSAIGSLVNAHVSCTNHGKLMAVAGVRDRVKQILTATQVASLFKFYPDVASAETALDQATSQSASSSNK